MANARCATYNRGAPIEDPCSITSKLAGSTTRLSTMQDLAGARITVPTFRIQQAITEAVLVRFTGQNAKIVRETVDSADSPGCSSS